jgi:hypothetical protein
MNGPPLLSTDGLIYFSIDQRGTAAGFVAVRVRVICAGTVPARLAAVIIMIGRRMPTQRAGPTQQSHSFTSYSESSF